MPTTSAEGWTLTEAHRLAQARLAAAVVGDVARLWPYLNGADLDGSLPAFAARIIPLVRGRRALSAGLAGGYFQTLRRLDAAPGTAATLSGADVEAERLLTSLSVTASGTWKRATGRGADPGTASAAARAAATRALQRHVLDGGRQTLLRSVDSDPAAHGYFRVSDGNPCAFCAMLVSRGAVYSKRVGEAGFRSHDGCGCSMRPFWEASPTEHRAASELRAFYDSATAGVGYKEAPAAFRKAYDARGASVRRLPSAA